MHLNNHSPSTLSFTRPICPPRTDIRQRPTGTTSRTHPRIQIQSDNRQRQTFNSSSAAGRGQSSDKGLPNSASRAMPVPQGSRATGKSVNLACARNFDRPPGLGFHVLQIARWWWAAKRRHHCLIYQNCRCHISFMPWEEFGTWNLSQLITATDGSIDWTELPSASP